MAETDWTLATNVLSPAGVARGVTNGIARPLGGGSFVYGFNSLDVVSGAVALFANQTNFAPTPANKGGSIRGAIKRMPSGGVEGFSPFLFIGMQGPDIADFGYLLGLEDNDPHAIVLYKGSIVAGVPEFQGAGQAGAIAKSSKTFANDSWVHLRLDMVSNTNGDVALNVWENDLVSNPVSSPVWQTVDGISNPIIDDALGVNTGTAPFTEGRMGFGFAVSDVARRAAFDHIEAFRQV
jgi:hypothetical protein